MGSCSVTVVHRVIAIYRAVIYKFDCKYEMSLFTSKYSFSIFCAPPLRIKLKSVLYPPDVTAITGERDKHFAPF